MDYEQPKVLAQDLMSVWSRLSQEHETVEVYVEVSEDDFRYVETVSDDGDGNVVLVLGREGSANR